MRQGLSTKLDPKGLRILKRKLLSGEITPQVFKEVLKRQMVKQALRFRTRPLLERWRTLIDSARGRIHPDVTVQAGPFQPGPLDMEELFTMARMKRL